MLRKLVDQPLCPRAKGDKRQLRRDFATVSRVARIAPADKPAQDGANDRRSEWVTTLVALDHGHRFLGAEDPIASGEPTRSYNHLQAGRRPDIAQPISGRSESADYDRLAPFSAVLDDFQHGFVAKTGMAADMDE